MITELTLDKLPKKVLEKIDIQTAFMASRCVVAAEKFQIFRLLHKKEMTLASICKKTGIQGYRAEFFLAALIAMGLLKKKGIKYTNTALANKYYVEERSIYWTRMYSKENMEEYFAFFALEDMLTTGKGYETILGKRRKWLGNQMKRDKNAASEFTHALYYDHIPDSIALAKNLDLSGYKAVLDIAGGSGVMSIALVRKNKHIKACVLDQENVIATTKKIIKREKLSHRISTVVGDMNKHIPTGYDVMMLCDAPKPTKEGFQKMYDSLPKGGMIVMVENFSSPDYTEPFYRLMWQLRSNRPWLITHEQAKDIIRKAGFKSVKKKNIWKDVWMITGIKRK